MFFLLRMAFWLSVVLILLPSGAMQHGASANKVGASDAISAASATVGDLRGFCAREPNACTVGSQVATELGYKAQAGAKMLYQVLTETLGSHQGGSRNAAAEQTSQNTLTPADLAPAWRGPAERKVVNHRA